MAADRPNILFLIADDQSYETVAAHGHVDIDTPNLDQLAKQGLTFTHAYNMGSWSGAVCVASRTMLNTGRYLWYAHRVYGQSEQERQAGRFWSEHMKRAGYRTYMTGKWHVRANAAKAFDTVAHVRGGMPNQTPQGYLRPVDGQPDPWDPADPRFGGFWKGGKHWSEVVADDAISFLDQASGDNNPFFMYIAFNAPHDPRQSPREYLAAYPLSRIELPWNFLPSYPYREEMAAGHRLRDERLAPWPRTPFAIKVHRREYFSIITHMDHQIGRILDHLVEAGFEDNTYVFFTADHGLAVGHHGLLGKQNMYDHSVRVPFLVAGPDVPRGEQVQTPVYLQDVMPTTLELAGIDKPDHVQFHSILPAMLGDSFEPYDAIYGAYLRTQRMVTDDGWKLIIYPEAKAMRLFDLENDPEERFDLSDVPEHQARKWQLFEKLLELQKEVGDELDLTGLRLTEQQADVQSPTESRLVESSAPTTP